ncbi:MAG: RelA/SpoT family protein [Bacteroidales bacterium]|nr:RelA/SpoT family protein [Bacteroidales bacterium]
MSLRQTNSKEEDDKIEEQFQALLTDYKSSPHRQKVELITKAFNFANDAHRGIRRRSGEPYILHPIAVARIVAKDMGLGSTSICSALLHDVVEDTDYTVEDIENLFGPKIAQIVNGLTKIAGGIFGDKASSQAENFRKLLLTMSEDIRVILIKMADRLHNMRTLDSMQPNKQYKIAGETQYLYAPLANRLGLHSIKSELEDLSFKYEHPETYREISARIAIEENQRLDIYTQFSTPVRARLDKMNIDYDMTWRTKSIYSVWRKMESKQISFEEIYDLCAARVIFRPKDITDEKIECWNIYTVITDIYKLHPERIRDWVSRPKANGYQALHLTVMGPQGQWIEVQIRSERMNDIAEKGLAAHVNYKTDANEPGNELNVWLRTIRDILENPGPSAMDFLDSIKLNLYATEIFVFTPKGEIKTLPQEATALDFAFALHSQIGLNCIGAKVNHKLVPLSHKLLSGDQVEILTSKSHWPQPDWFNYVTTTHARNLINKYLQKDDRLAVHQGEAIVKAFIAEHLQGKPESVNLLIQIYNVASKEELFRLVGKLEIVLDLELIMMTNEKRKNLFVRYFNVTFGVNKGSKKSKNNTKGQIDKKKNFVLEESHFDVTYKFSPCCRPLPYDDALGYINDVNLVEVHKRSCPVATKLKSAHGDRLLSIEWRPFTSHTFQAGIEVKGVDGIGVLNDITRVLSEQLSMSIQKIHIETKDGIFEGIIDFQVQSANDLDTLCTKLGQVKNLTSVKRVDGK